MGLAGPGPAAQRRRGRSAPTGEGPLAAGVDVGRAEGFEEKGEEGAIDGQQGDVHGAGHPGEGAGGEDDDGVEGNCRKGGEKKGVGAIPAAVLTEGHLDGPDQHRPDARQEGRASMFSPPQQADCDRDPPDEDQDLGEREGMPWSLRTLAGSHLGGGLGRRFSLGEWPPLGAGRRAALSRAPAPAAVAVRQVSTGPAGGHCAASTSMLAPILDLMSTPSAPAPSTGEGIPESPLPGPFPVGEYAAALRARLREFTRVQLFGELVNLRPSRTRVYFELRDSDGAVPCAVWLREWEAMSARAGSALADGMQVVVAGGCDYYPGSSTSSPGFSFTVSDLRVAGEGDLLARIERLRKQLDGEGLLEPQKLLERPFLPRTIGVVTSEGGKAKDDIIAGLTRRGWGGRVVWGFAPVQDRHAAPAIARVLGDLAAVGGVDVVIVARGGGSLADLLCFCDETLCRTVAMLGVPVIASVGHHTDRTLLDDVAAVSCSTPTHAAEVAVAIDCAGARVELGRAALRLRENGGRAMLARARQLASLSRAPSEHLARQRTRLHQQMREIRAGSRRRVGGERAVNAQRALVLKRKADASLLDCRRRRPRELERLALALAGHEPQRTLERGYALVEDPSGRPLQTAAQASLVDEVHLRFADGVLPARTSGGPAGTAGAAGATSGPAGTAGAAGATSGPAGAAGAAGATAGTADAAGAAGATSGPAARTSGR